MKQTAVQFLKKNRHNKNKKRTQNISETGIAIWLGKKKRTIKWIRFAKLIISPWQQKDGFKMLQNHFFTLL